MKFFVSLTIAIAFLFQSIETKAQITIQTIFNKLLVEPIKNDTNGVDFILQSGAFAAQKNDEHTYYKMKANRVGFRMRGCIEHFEHIFLYSDVFYDAINYENLHTQPTSFSKHKEIGIELGAGMRFPVHLGHSGFILEGEFTTPFHIFDPALLTALKWEKNRTSVAFGNKIFARNASLLNLELDFEYKILPRKKKK